MFKDYDVACDEIKVLSKEKWIVFVIDYRRSNSKHYLILCGSSMNFMEKQVIGQESPLFGRGVTYHYYIVSKGGFTEKLIQAAQNGEVTLVSLEEMCVQITHFFRKSLWVS